MNMRYLFDLTHQYKLTRTKINEESIRKLFNLLKKLFLLP